MVYTLTVHLYANDKPDSIERIKAKLVEAARVYRKDKETVDWFVMQDVHDPRAFTIVERFAEESVSVSETTNWSISCSALCSCPLSPSTSISKALHQYTFNAHDISNNILIFFV